MSLVEARDLFCVYPGADGGVAALQGLTLDVGEGGDGHHALEAGGRRGQGGGAAAVRQRQVLGRRSARCRRR